MKVESPNVVHSLRATAK